MASTKKPVVSKKALQMIDTKQSDDLAAVRERDKSLTMLEIFGGDEQKTAIASDVSKLIAKGYDDHKIIEHIRYTYGLVWSMQRLGIVKKMIHKIWRAEMAHNAEDYKAKELAVIEVMMSETWEAWEKSKNAKHKKSRKEHSRGDQKAGTDYDLTEEIVDEDDTAGDPRYMQILQKLSDQRVAILGLKAAEDKSVGGGGSTNIQINVVGDSATAKSADLLSTVMNMGALYSGAVQQQPVAEVAEAEVVETRVPATQSVDSVVEDLMQMYMG